MNAFELLGWLFFIVPLMWLTVACYFVTVPTFGEAMFTGKWYEKLIGVILWVLLISLWVYWFTRGVNVA